MTRKIYDCFIFNNELDLLELRLKFLYKHVDYFVLVESSRTLSGFKKPLTFALNKKRFNAYSNKIIYLEAPAISDLAAWDYEEFQRDYIRKGLVNCQDNDIIFISDLDEIINVKEIIESKPILPAVIELPVCYYYFNLVSEDIFRYNLVAEYKTIKQWDLGVRDFLKRTNNIVEMKKVNTGWHFSFLFGENIEKYQNKIKSFSHQEYNNDYFLDQKRILKCVQTGKDVFERNYKYYFYHPNFLKPLLSDIYELKMDNFIKKRTTFDVIRTIIRKVHVLLFEIKMHIKSLFHN